MAVEMLLTNAVGQKGELGTASKIGGSGGGGGGAVDSVNGKTGTVVLDADDVGAEPKKFIVTVTESSGTYTADKTIDEINSAFSAGMLIEGVMGFEVYAAFYVSPVAVIFTAAFNDMNGKSGITSLLGVSSNGTDTWTYHDKILEQVTAAVTVTGATPTITPVDNTVYKCGELTSLTISNPPATGAYVIKFSSGSTATTTTIPSSIVFPEAFSAEANTRYEINVEDGYAVAVGWPVSSS